MKLKELPKVIHGIGGQKGRKFLMVNAKGGVYMYSVQSGDITMYEVFKAKIRDGLDIYPKRSDFGKIAFGVSDYNEAEKLFYKMSNY